MIRYIQILFVTAFLSNSALGQAFNRDQLAVTVVRLVDQTNLFSTNTAGQIVITTHTESGTGFFVTTSNSWFLVTAGHIAGSMHGTSRAIIQGDNDMPLEIGFQELFGNAAQQNWIFHTNADVAIHRLLPSVAVSQKYLQHRFLPLPMLVSQKTAPSRETPLTVMGFPLGLGTIGNFSPLTQQTRAASGFITFAESKEGPVQTFFLLENPSIDGFSGSPCFDISIYQVGNTTSTGSGTKCYGLIHSTLIDVTGGKMAAVVPSFQIVELIKQNDH
jgi:hypothetical protein